MNESHIWIRGIRTRGDAARSQTRFYESLPIYERVIPHIWMSHVTHMNESCHTYEWVMSHIWMSHVTHMNESCHTPELSHTYEKVIGEWVMSHVWMSHVACVNESWQGMLLEAKRASTSRGIYMNESWHTYEWVMSHIWMSQVVLNVCMR